MLKIAVLQDDCPERDDILITPLTARGFDVKGFGIAKKLFQQMLVEAFDVVVLDVKLLDSNDFEILRYLRAHSDVCAITLANSHSSSIDCFGLQVEASFIAPVDIEQLALLLSGLEKRTQTSTLAAASMEWRLDSTHWRLHAPNGRSVALTFRERALMEQLLAVAGNAIPREKLILLLNDDAEDFDPHRLEMLIYRLRIKVKTATGLSLPLHGIHGKGYAMPGLGRTIS